MDRASEGAEWPHKIGKPSPDRYSFVSNIIPVSTTESILCEPACRPYPAKSHVLNILVAVIRKIHSNSRSSKSFYLNILPIKSLESRFCKPDLQRITSNLSKINIVQILILKKSLGLLHSLQPGNQLLRQALI
jgi:hypothetical protein